MVMAAMAVVLAAPAEVALPGSTERRAVLGRMEPLPTTVVVVAAVAAPGAVREALAAMAARVQPVGPGAALAQLEPSGL
jgi:hypothetical protein